MSKRLLSLFLAVLTMVSMLSVLTPAASAAAAASVDVALVGISENQIPRATTQEFSFEIYDTSGNVIDPSAAKISYSLSEEGIVTIDETAHTLFAEANGTVEIAVSATYGGKTVRDTLELTVADAGGNLMSSSSSSFEDGSTGSWYNFSEPGDEAAFLWSSVEDDGTGNKALKIQTNPDMSPTNGTGATFLYKAGYYVKVQPGRLYEVSYRIKIDEYNLPEDAVSFLRLLLQVYDYGSAYGGTSLNQISTSVNANQKIVGEWVEVKLPVRAPSTYDGDIYLMPRFSVRPNFNTENSKTGWDMTAWLDDFAIREVGYESLAFEYIDEPTEADPEGTMVLWPMTTTGALICLNPDNVIGNATLTSGNENVLQIVSEAGEYAKGEYEYPIFDVKLAGLNDTAELEGSLTIGDRTVTGTTQVTVSGIKDTLRDVQLTIRDAESLVLQRGDTAQSNVVGRSTQLNEIDVSHHDGIYYTSSDPGIATVDAETGEVTALNEGSTEITVYIKWLDQVYKDTALLTVDDAADLTEITVGANVDYVGTGNALAMQITGKKASGGKADMSRYPVAWSVDNEAASITQDGVLTGISQGNVTVTASILVHDVLLTSTMQIEVVDNQMLDTDQITVAFDEGRIVGYEDMTLESTGYCVDFEKTTDGGRDIVLDAQGFIFKTEKDGQLVIDFVVKKDGWYRMNAYGKQITYMGKVCDVFVDDVFVNVMDFGSANSNSGAGGKMNTIYLTAGVHELTIVSSTDDSTIFFGRADFYPTSDPEMPEITMDAGKTSFIVGETATLRVSAEDANGEPFFLRNCATKPDYTNYYLLESSDSSVLSVSGTTLTAKKAGTATIKLTGEANGQSVSKELTVKVANGSFLSAELSAPETTVKPDHGTIALSVTTYALDGTAQTSVPSDVKITYKSMDTSIATVSSSGVVTITGKEGSAEVIATLTEGNYEVQAPIWISVSKGKTEPTVYTYQERTNAKNNVNKYYWAWKLKDAAVKKADVFVEHLDAIYDMWIYETFPRATRVGFKNTDHYRYCTYCGVDLVAKYSVYPYQIDAFNKPWKITCPDCKRDFPSNDFESYYKSGLGEDGRFYAENADPQYLVNELYPEMGEGWGVDDGFGYFTGETEASTGVEVCYTYIAYYLCCVFEGLDDESESLPTILSSLREAYLYTGKAKYGQAGAILIDRIADIYPEYDTMKYDFSRYASSDGGGGKGKFIGLTWDAIIGRELARCVDAFWPCMDDPEVVSYLQERAPWKGVTADEITPDYIRKNAEDNILLELFRCAKCQWIQGNFGMCQSAVGYAAVALNRLPESKEMVDWIFREEKQTGYAYTTVITGGDVMRTLVEEIDRDGFGNEGSYSYNSIMEGYVLDVADALDGFTLVENADLYQNPKFISMYSAAMRFTVGGHLTPQIHESGQVQSTNFLPNIERMTAVFARTGDVDIAKAIYAANGNAVTGLHGDIFMEDPDAGIQNQIKEIVKTYGEWDLSESNMLAGYGIAILRNAPQRYEGLTENAHEFFDYWIGFGHTYISHAQKEALNLDLHAFGLNVSSSMGYPTVVQATDYERMQWVMNTVSNNTVVVNDKAQSSMREPGFPLHFADDGYAKVMDVEASKAYEETDIYRRTVVTVQAPNGVDYAVDFFRVLGGEEHVYSFHGATMIEPETEGLSMVKQPFGTYAGADVPYGAYKAPGTDGAYLNMGSGYSWLDDVSRDNSPEATFSVDWEIEDFQSRLPNSAGIHLKLTMLSEDPMTEVALADGHPPKKKPNPDHLEYLLVRRSGEPGMDTLFTAVIEPYQTQMQVVKSELVEVKLVDGTEQINDRVAAVKTTLVNGREDYIIYATNPGCTYRVDGKFSFKGFTGVVSYENGKITYAWGSEVTTVADFVVDAKASVTGTVVEFTEGLSLEGYTMTIEMDEPAYADELKGRWIYVENDGIENGAYQIHDAEVIGNIAVLDLKNQTLVRKYVDAMNIDKGYIHNIASGQSFSIPLSASATEPAIEKFNIAGANMTLGNDLKMNFLIKKSDMKNGYVAYVSQAGGEPVRLELWSYDATYYAASYSVAAKEMTDVLSVEIVDANGNVVSNPFTRTVKQYAMTLLNNASQKASLKSVIVDMLNYGTEAQKYFGHNEDAYANAEVTAEQQETYATKEVECVNNQQGGTNFVGANLSLEDSILLNVFFRGITNGDLTGVTATVSFTDYLGNEVTADAEIGTQGTSMVKVVVNQIVLADAKRPVTVTVYRDGAEFGTGVESVESYIARNLTNSSTGALNMAIMKFSASAYNHLGGTK